jgi:UDPglucose 6-dehydrogenase
MKVSVIGLGYVGSVAAGGLASAGHEVLGIDVDRERIQAYRSGTVPIYEPRLGDLIAGAVAQHKLRFLHPDEVNEPIGEVAVIAAGTPPFPNGSADLSQVRSAISWVAKRLTSGGVIVMKSTVPSGTGVRLCDTILKDTSSHYVSNPEFLREGQAIWDWFHPDRIVIGGADSGAIEKVKELYSDFEAPCVVTDITSAEMIKYAANAFLATKISFINEIAMVCDRINASIDDVVKGISLDPRIGSSFLRAGVGYGGSCFPKDVDSLDHIALTNGHSFELLRSVIAVNNRQRLLPLHALRECFGRLQGVTVAVLGITFKPHTDDIRESPAIDVIRLLAEEGAIVKAYDPRAVPIARKVLPETVNLVESPLECAEGAQALVLMTEWPEIVEADWKEIARLAREPHLLFDGRNALDASEMQKYGFNYRGIGRGSSAPIRRGAMIKA